MAGQRQRSRQARRGANAIEFALIAPVLVMMLAGLIDYGWYFWQQAQVVNGLRESVRAGAMQLPLTTETGSTCSKCISMASTSASSELSKLGYSGLTIAPKIERIPATGTPCTYAVVLDMTLSHQPLFDLVPSPEKIDVRVVSMAQNLTCP